MVPHPIGEFIMIFLNGWVRALIGIPILMGIALATGCHRPPTITHRVYLGYGSSERPLSSSLITTLSKDAGKPSMLMIDMAMDEDMPTRDIQRCHRHQIVPVLVIHPQQSDGGVVPLADIVAGKWSDMVGTWSQALASFEDPVLVLFAPDFNLEYTPWGVAKNNQNSALFKQAYQQVAMGLRLHNPPSLMMVWGVGASNLPDTDWNDPLLAYPGDDYVDWVAISATDRTTPLVPMYKRMLTTLSQHIEKPVMLTHYFHESSPQSDAALVAALMGPFKSVDAVLVSNKQWIGQVDKTTAWWRHPLFAAPYSALMDAQ
ncbi:hypothetical protein EBZ35_05760 [bacterium]|nr:hypothetical protein [bacterium]